MTQEDGNPTNIFTIMDQQQMTNIEKVCQKTENDLVKKEKSPEYDPYAQRDVLHPTSDLETLVHLMKASLGTGILAMPMAFKNAGIWTGLVGSIVISGISTYCVAIYIDCAYVLCQKNKIPSVGFQKLTELAFLEGPEYFKKYSKIAGKLVKYAVLAEALGGCCAYSLFVAKSIKQVIEYYYDVKLQLHVYLLLILPLLIVTNLLRSLKHLAPLSLISNLFFLFGVFVSYYFIFDGDLPPVSERPAFSSLEKLPLFFGTTIFALEGIGVVMPLENSMRNPKHFNHCPGILYIGMGVLTILYVITGFFGYLKYGDKVEPSLTLNLPIESTLGQVLKILVAIAVFFNYSLFFYVAMDVWDIVNGRRFKERKLLKENISRIFTVSATVLFAALFPKLGALLALIGAFTLCTLGLIFPPIVDALVYWKQESFLSWRSLRNLVILICGIIGFFSGTITSLKEFSNESST